jgi:hypothetical protein
MSISACELSRLKDNLVTPLPVSSENLDITPMQDQLNAASSLRYLDLKRDDEIATVRSGSG